MQLFSDRGFVGPRILQELKIVQMGVYGTRVGSQLLKPVRKQEGSK